MHHIAVKTMITRVARQRMAALGRSNLKLHLRSFSEKHDIESFKKQKTVYRFGLSKDPEVERRSIDFSEFDAPQVDLREHPSLVGLRPNSPEYKQQLHALEQEQRGEQEKSRSHYEFMERMKAVGAGALALAGVISAYQLIMNYKYLKAYVNAKWNHNWDDSAIKDMNDPKGNTRTLSNLTEKLNVEIDDDFMAALQPSETTPGVYLFGQVANKKLPSRVKGFDSKYFQDLLVRNDLVVAIDDGGAVFHYSPTMDQPVKVKTPSRMSRVFFSGNKLYYLSSNKKDLYCESKVAQHSSNGWFGSTSSSVGKVAVEGLERGEKIEKISAGMNHLLLLTSKGRLFEINTAEAATNKGQYALPTYSPTKLTAPVPFNTAYELKTLNYEVVGSGEKKTLQPRAFKDIAVGSFHNVVVDGQNNVWSWGDNAYSQCGVESSTIGDVQPVPRLVFSIGDLRNIAKYSLPDKGTKGTLDIKGVQCSDETSILKLCYNHSTDSAQDQDLILGFGNGLKGQLGLSRYLHKIGLPLVIKSLIGMKEYDTVSQMTTNVGIKDVIPGGNHIFVVLNNAGSGKDVLVFGDNERGQFGNGKTVKSSKPLNLPKLLEPSDFEAPKKELVKKVNDQTTNRLQLLESSINGQRIEQVLAAGEDSSAIFYRKK